MARETLEVWIRRQLTDPVLTLDGTRKCVAIGLIHFRSGIQTEVQTVKLGGKEWSPEQLSELFNGLADQYAGSISPDESGSGYEQFQVISFFSDVPDLIVGRMPLNRKTGPRIPEGGVASEAPDARGELKQSMRHREGWMQFTLDMVARTYSAQLGMIESLTKRLNQADRENFDAIQLAKETILERAADTHAHQIAELEYARKTEERRKLLQLAPGLANQLLGKEIFPSAAVDTSLLETFVESLPENEEAINEVIGVLSKHLKPEAVGVLVGRLAEIQEGINKRKALAKKENGKPS